MGMAASESLTTSHSIEILSYTHLYIVSTSMCYVIDKLSACLSGISEQVCSHLTDCQGLLTFVVCSV